MGIEYSSFEKSNFFNSFDFVREVDDDHFGELYVFENRISKVPVLV